MKDVEFKGAYALEEDIKYIVSKLRVLRTCALFGRTSRPILKYHGGVLKGIPLSDDNFFNIEDLLDDIEFPKADIYALDASMKLIFDFGSFKVYAVKVVIERFKKYRSEVFSSYYRLISAENREDALRELSKIEYRVILKLLNVVSNSIVLLDRPIFNNAFYHILTKASVYRNNLLIGLCKSSSITLEDGTPLIGYLCMRAGVLGLRRWYYYPLFREDKLNLRILILKLSSEDNFLAFRVDVYDYKNRPIDEIVRRIASLEDPSHPGYPYPLIRAHRDSKLRKHEISILREYILDNLAFNMNLDDSVMLRREELEGRSSFMG